MFYLSLLMSVFYLALSLICLTDMTLVYTEFCVPFIGLTAIFVFFWACCLVQKSRAHRCSKTVRKIGVMTAALSGLYLLSALLGNEEGAVIGGSILSLINGYIAYMLISYNSDTRLEEEEERLSQAVEAYLEDQACARADKEETPSRALKALKKMAMHPSIADNLEAQERVVNTALYLKEVGKNGFHVSGSLLGQTRKLAEAYVELNEAAIKTPEATDLAVRIEDSFAKIESALGKLYRKSCESRMAEIEDTLLELDIRLGMEGLINEGLEDSGQGLEMKFGE